MLNTQLSCNDGDSVLIWVFNDDCGKFFTIGGFS